MQNIFAESTAYADVQKWIGRLCKIVSCFHWKESGEGSVAHQRNEKEDSLHFQWSFASCSSTNQCVMAFIFLVSQLIFLDENIEKIRRICLLATYTHVIQIKLLVWEVEITAFDRGINSVPLCYREKLTKPFVFILL